MKVLFICKGNMVRSPMAAAIYNQITHTHDAISAGTYTGTIDEPEGRMLTDLFPDPAFFQIMEKYGIKIRENRTKKLLPEMITNADIVVSMAEEPFIPDFLRNNEKVIIWNIKNPTSAEHEAEKIYRQLTNLIKELVAEVESSIYTSN